MLALGNEPSGMTGALITVRNPGLLGILHPPFSSQLLAVRVNRIISSYLVYAPAGGDRDLAAGSDYIFFS